MAVIALCSIQTAVDIVQAVADNAVGRRLLPTLAGVATPAGHLLMHPDERKFCFRMVKPE